MGAEAHLPHQPLLLGPCSSSAPGPLQGPLQVASGVDAMHRQVVELCAPELLEGLRTCCCPSLRLQPGSSLLVIRA